jgi:hypothetical protein
LQDITMAVAPSNKRQFLMLVYFGLKINWEVRILVAVIGGMGKLVIREMN